MKWNLNDLKELMRSDSHPKMVDHKFLLQVRGFFNHFAIACDIMVPFSNVFIMQLRIEGMG